MHNFRKLDVWSKARELVKATYEATGTFPEAEKFGLTSQVRRAVVSIPANIAEGAGRNTDPDFARFLSITQGSAYEVECLLILAFDLNYINEPLLNELTAKLHQIQKMIAGLKNKLSNNLVEEPTELYETEVQYPSTSI